MKVEPCFNLAIRKAARVITQFYEGRFAEVGLKVGQFSILRVTHFRKVTNSKELQQFLVIDQTTLSRNLKPLLRDGLLEQSTAEGDLRIKNISLTSKGKKLYKEALPIWQETQQAVKDMFGEIESDQILSNSDLLVKTLSKT